MLGNHQQLLKGPQLYDDLTRVPLIMRWPGKILPGAIFKELVQWVDLAVHWVQSFDDVFMNTAGDVTLLPKILDAASRYSKQEAITEDMQALENKSGLSSLFGLGV